MERGHYRARTKAVYDDEFAKRAQEALNDAVRNKANGKDTRTERTPK